SSSVARAGVPPGEAPARPDDRFAPEQSARSRNRGEEESREKKESRIAVARSVRRAGERGLEAGPAQSQPGRRQQQTDERKQHAPAEPETHRRRVATRHAVRPSWSVPPASARTAGPSEALRRRRFPPWRS